MTDAELKKFFLSQLARAKPQVSAFIPTAPDASVASYFVDVIAPEAIVREQDMIASLVDIWRNEGLDKLVALEPQLRKMARALRAPKAQSESVSGFIYPMY
ncbi:MAG TPA: hypothetical protein VL598_12905 [Trinickia sp.]|uniref:hypothetical protein n=1 Tax=Trinickia sp. TaxID=2571163 RepID=UPI002C15CC6C|nr:hypothetical protein [Trinickia sp.]HTI18558.1 hypothetical protein [Trinickia sp.]